MTVKPFYIRHTPEITDKQVAEVFDKAVACGAQLGNGVEGFHSDEQCTHAVHQPSWYLYFGITTDNETWISDITGLFGEEITLDQVDEWLGIAKQLPNIKGTRAIENVDPVKHATGMYDQQKMLERDERGMSPQELEWRLAQTSPRCADPIPVVKTIPSTLPTQQAMPMMLGGEFGGVNNG